MNKNLQFLLLFIYPVFVCCGKSTEFVAGQITDSISCSQKTGQYYALYLPKGYSNTKKYPIIFFFDPSARGKLPLEKYKYVADSFQVILAGSDNSKNGPTENNTIAANSMISDIKTRITNIDESAIILAGFSGGSRFAYYYSIMHPEIKGVIGCGASFPGQTQEVFPPRFNYALIAGFADFNFRELYQVKEIFRSNNVPLCFIPFNGKHEWPDSESFKTALQYQLFCFDVKDAKEKAEQLMVDERKKLAEYRDSNNLMATKWCLENLLVIEYKSFKTSSYIDTLQTLTNNTDFLKQSTLFSKSLRIEDSLTQEIIEVIKTSFQSISNPEIQNKPFKWWEKEIGKFTMLENSDEIYLRAVGKRLKSQICIQQWEVNRKFAGAGLYDKSLESARILILANPDEPIYLALKAESLLALGKTKEAKSALDSALAKGYSFDEPSLKNNAYLAKLRNL